MKFPAALWEWFTAFCRQRLWENEPPRLAAGGRSPRWPTCRKRHLERQPLCQGCGRDHGLDVHHIYPVHFPLGVGLELSPENLITLCPDCHFRIGHLMDWQAANMNVRADAAYFRSRVAERVYPGGW